MEKPAEVLNADLGGLNIPPADSPSTGADSTGANVSASAETIRQRKTRSDIGKPRGSRSAPASASVQPLSAPVFAQLYSPEIWQKALCAPADAMAAISGKAHWQVSEKERQALGATGSIAAQCFAVSDPRWLALALCAITVLDVYGVRLALDLADRKKKAEEEKKKKQGVA